MSTYAISYSSGSSVLMLPSFKVTASLSSPMIKEYSWSAPIWLVFVAFSDATVNAVASLSSVSDGVAILLA